MNNPRRSARNRYHPYQQFENGSSNQSDGEQSIDISTRSDVPPEAIFNNKSESKCVICLDTETYIENYSLPCGHTFHLVCIDSWLVRKRKCPICRHSAAQPTEVVDIDEFDSENFENGDGDYNIDEEVEENYEIDEEDYEIDEDLESDQVNFRLDDDERENYDEDYDEEYEIHDQDDQDIDEEYETDFEMNIISEVAYEGQGEIYENVDSSDTDIRIMMDFKNRGRR